MPSQDYQRDRDWSDKFILEMKRIIGPYLLEPSPFEIDTKQAGDLIVMRAKNVCIACRVRRNSYLEQYGNEFTLRYARDNGYETEHSKIINGWADWMFYGFAHENDYRRDFAKWSLLDLSAFRAHLILDHKRKQVQGKKIDNRDGTHLIAYKIPSFQGDPQLLIAQSTNAMYQLA